jgi:hypothetical protein
MTMVCSAHTGDQAPSARAMAVAINVFFILVSLK